MPAPAPARTRTQKILAWTPAILVSVFLILASALPKLFLSGEASSLQPFAESLGMWDFLFRVGVLELSCAVLFLIPRTSTVGFLLMVSLLGGALATGLTHPEVTEVWPWFPGVLLALITLSAYYRLPELLDRLRGRPVPVAPLWLRIPGWIAAALVALMNVFAAVTKLLPQEPGSQAMVFSQRLGMDHILMPLGILELVVVAFYLIPRTVTVGYVLMAGYLAGAVATNLTHGFTAAETMPLYVLLALLTLSALGRNPEVLTRLLGRPLFPERV